MFCGHDGRSLYGMVVYICCVHYGCMSFYRIGSNPQLISPLKHSLDATADAKLSESINRNCSQTPTVIQSGQVLSYVVNDVEQCGGYSVYNNDFRRFDPRLSLNIDLNVFKAENEQLLLLLKVCITLLTYLSHNQNCL